MANLPNLFRLQEIESRRLTLRKKRQQLDEDPDVKRRSEQIKGVAEQLKMAQTKRQSALAKQRQLELDLQSGQERLKAENNKLYSGSITNSRELEQIQQKVSEYAKKCSQTEEELLQFMEHDEQAAGEIAGLTKVLAGLEQELAQAKQHQAGLILEITMEEQELEDDEALVITAIPADWLERFRRIAKSHNGVGIAKVKTDSCGACHISLSESMLQKVKRGEDTLLYCENCGRILFY